jgi:5-methyltetrahydrofolate--homocysteine methyltransferase
MAAYACLARDAGARVIGGCCGTTADHVRAMVAALARHPQGPLPERATIEAALGPLGTLPSGEPMARRRSRRRGEQA